MIKVLKSGLYTSIQDLGRFGYRNYGVPVSGAMDKYHSQLANQLLNNDKAAAVLEITLQGPQLLFEQDTKIVITGANLSPYLNQQLIKHNEVIAIAEGDVIEFHKRIYGSRTYLAIEGGIQTPVVMGSRSFYKSITEIALVNKKDRISYLPMKHKKQPSYTSMRVSQELFESTVLRVFKGPEFEFLSKEQQQSIEQQEFTIGLNNRMAYQLSEAFENNLPSIITSGVLPGTVQLTPSGKLIILMADSQTTGGYPRVLQLDQQGINILSQKIKGDKISFQILNI